jgi:serine protease Do
LAPLAFTGLRASAQQVPTDFTAIVKQKMPAFVPITTKQRVEEQEQAQPLPDDLPFCEFFRRYYGELPEPRRQQTRQALGSSFVISADGHIMEMSR